MGNEHSSMRLCPNIHHQFDKGKMPRRAVRPPSKTRRKPAAHLLIIEAQTGLLHQQHMAFGTNLHAVLSGRYAEKIITLAATNLRAELADRLGAIRKAHARYRTVFIVAHSNPTGIKLTNEDFCTWTVLGAWLKEFSPEHLFLVACDAGQLQSICDLFKALPSLHKIYASPVPINPYQATHLTKLVEQLLTNRRVDETMLRVTQAASFLLARGVLFQWTRSDCQSHNKVRGLAQIIGAQFLK